MLIYEKIKIKNGAYYRNTRLQFHYKTIEYATFILEIYASLCIFNIKLNYNKNTNTIKPTQSYNFAIRSLTKLIQLHSNWYCFDSNLNKYVKIVPLNIANLLSAHGLANWIMDYGWWRE
jgi:LAGLIDADG DNA endonuclease family.